MCRFVSRFQNATSLEDLMRVMMKASLSGEELFMNNVVGSVMTYRMITIDTSSLNTFHSV